MPDVIAFAEIADQTPANLIGFDQIQPVLTARGRTESDSVHVKSPHGDIELAPDPKQATHAAPEPLRGYFNPKTGTYTHPGPLGTGGVVDSPYVLGRGVVGLAKSAASADGPGAVSSLNDIADGVFGITTPLVVGAAVGAPLKTALALAKAGIAAHVGTKAAEAMGASPDMQRLTGNIAAVLSGATSLSGAVEKMRTDAQSVIRQAKAFDLANPEPGAPPPRSVGRGQTDAAAANEPMPAPAEAQGLASPAAQAPANLPAIRQALELPPAPEQATLPPAPDRLSLPPTAEQAALPASPEQQAFPAAPERRALGPAPEPIPLDAIAEAVDTPPTAPAEAIPLEHIAGPVEMPEAPVAAPATPPPAPPRAAIPSDPTLANHDALVDRLRSGDLIPTEVRDGFERIVASKDALVAELSTMTKDQLLKRMGGMSAAHYKGDKKNIIVAEAYRQLLSDFVLSNSIAYNPMEKGGYEKAIRGKLEPLTESDLAGYAESVAQAKADRKARIAGLTKAATNPETLDEFNTFVRLHKKGEAALTPEQRVQYDELRAAENKDKRVVEQQKRATVEAAGEQVGASIVETKHTKAGYDLFVVQLAKRVERADYNRLNIAARKLGGWYSSFRGNGATAGFQFKTREAAEAFKTLTTEGDTAPAQEQALERREARGETTKNAASDRLAQMAETLQANADERLSADRLTNTSRRASMADSADARARIDLAMAKTIRNLSDAIESGKATHLDGIRTKTQIQTLDDMANAAKRDRLRKDYPEYRDYEKHEGRAVEATDIDEVEFPSLSTRKSDLVSAAGRFNAEKGGKRISLQMMALARRATGSDPIIAIPRDLVESAVSHAGQASRMLSWGWDASLIKAKRLEAAGITDGPSLRAALREFIQYRGAEPAVNKVKELERALAGRPDVGVDFFPTPAPLAREMAESLNLKPGMTVLEPSAGKGNLADAVREVEPEADIDTVEQSSTLREILKAKGYALAGHDFESFDPGKQYDRVIMNPPFSNGLDADHVERAYGLLKPGGRLIAITGEGIFFRNDKKAAAFRQWFESVGGRSEQMKDAFADRREVKTTSVASRLLTIDKRSNETQPNQPTTDAKADNPFRAKAERAQKQYDRAMGVSAHDQGMAESFPLGGGFARKGAAKRIDASVRQAVNAESLRMTAKILAAKARAFDAGEINKQGRSITKETR